MYFLALQNMLDIGDADELVNTFSTYLTQRTTQYESYHCFSKHTIKLSDIKKQAHCSLEERFNITADGTFHLKVKHQCPYNHEVQVKDENSVIILPDTILHGKGWRMHFTSICTCTNVWKQH
jgi:uncharacterized protein YaiE (UPF0345 family)